MSRVRAPLEILATGAARLAHAVERWAEVQERPAYRIGGVLLGIAVCGAIVARPPAEGLGVEAWRTLGVTLLMALWWFGGVLPITVTALVPLVAFPLLGIASIREVAGSFAHPLLFLMLGGFVLGRAMEVVGLHERLMAGLLQVPPLRRTVRGALLGLMGAAALLSCVVNNTATMTMMLPLAWALADRAAAPRRVRSAFALGLAYASSIGGVTTLIGTFPNAVLARFAGEQVGIEIGFAPWLLVGGAFSLPAIPVAWLLVAGMLVPAGGPPLAAPRLQGWRPGERAVLAVLGLALAAWLTRGDLALGPVHVPGWARLTGLGSLVDEAWVAIGAAILLFVIPVRTAEGARPLLSFPDVERHVPFSVLFLLGGGFALADGIERSGLTAWLGARTQLLEGLPFGLDVVAISVGVSFLTELTSNTATTQILLPLLASGAEQAGVAPLRWMIPATISASCAFMMAVATPPNAIAAQAGDVAPGDMVTVGLLLNLALAAWTAAVALLVVPWVFPG